MAIRAHQSEGYFLVCQLKTKHKGWKWIGYIWKRIGYIWKRIRISHVSIFLFPFPMMEIDRIRMEMDLDISDIHFPVSLLFPSLRLRFTQFYLWTGGPKWV